MAEQKVMPTLLKTEGQKLTGVKKRQQIELAGRTMFLWVAIAAVAVSFCFATGQYLFSKWQFNNKIIDAKYKATTTLTNNLSNAEELRKNIDGLVASLELDSVKTNKDDPNTKSVLDALPTSFDPAALATSLQQVILGRSGVSVESIVVPTQTAGENIETTDPTPQEMKFSVVVSAPYDKVVNLVRDMERTIRPIKINSVSMNGSDQSLRVTIDATTYYQPSRSVELKKEALK